MKDKLSKAVGQFQKAVAKVKDAGRVAVGDRGRRRALDGKGKAVNKLADAVCRRLVLVALGHVAYPTV